MPDQWSKLLTKSAITREDYAKDPQAVLDVLEFYTDHQKREQDDNVDMRNGGPIDAPARFNAGTGLGGKIGADRPSVKRQESSPNISHDRADSNGYASNTIGAGPSSRPPLPQASRTAPGPPRPLLTGTRPAPPAPKTSLDHTPSATDLRQRQKAAGPGSGGPPPRSDSVPQRPPRDPIEARQKTPERPPIAPAKSSPATTQQASHPVPGPAGATAGPPPVKPLQPKKVQVQEAEKPKTGGGVAAAAAALEKPDKPKEKRISTMTEVQIMEKLRQVVSEEDPKTLYSKIKKVGQGCVQ